MTTLKQEWDLVAQDQDHAVNSLIALCKARLVLHKATVYHAEVSEWAPASNIMYKISQYAVRDFGLAYANALHVWLEASA